MNANFSAYVNGVMLDDRTLTVDDYSSYKQRIIHIVINQSDLLELLEQNKNTKKMEFVLVPTNSVQKIAEYSIPQWIKNNAKWWSEDQIDDKTFASGIEFLIKEGIILVPETKPEGSTGKDIPSWIKNNAKWWADGLISDEDFVKGIQYLVEQEIIKVN
jgi:TusA-related sulfurtransferase